METPKPLSFNDMANKVANDPMFDAERLAAKLEVTVDELLNMLGINQQNY